MKQNRKNRDTWQLNLFQYNLMLAHDQAVEGPFTTR